ncbi:MAG: thiamine diphosphokinase [Clostridiales bacterium]|nr:thiamine diphosphokinase [Clostridiales bacterium]
MKAAVICSGSINSYSLIKPCAEEADIVICCDGGLRHCDAMGISPHLLAGDFDSAEPELLEEYKNKGIEILTAPCEKDFTDCELGIREAIKRGADEITLLGCTGTRFDHTLANCHMLMLPLKAGIKARIIDEHNIIYLIDRALSLRVKRGQTVSLIPLTNCVKGINTRGLYYPLNNGTLSIGSSYGVSNKAAEEKIEITLSEGLLFVMVVSD